jgi:hypothetical protein
MTWQCTINIEANNSENIRNALYSIMDDISDNLSNSNVDGSRFKYTMQIKAKPLEKTQ